jgi:hypothetical protein
MGSPQGLTPPALTPISWHHTNGSSLSGGAGQISAKARGSRGLVIGCVAALVVLAGAGGFIASNLLRKSDRGEAHVMAPQPTKAPEVEKPKVETPTVEQPKTETAKAETAKTETAKAETAKAETAQVETKSETPKVTKSETTKTAKSETPRVVSSKVTKTVPKTKADTTRPKVHKDKPVDDLFNDRH